MTACPFCELNLGDAAAASFDKKPEGAAIGGKYKGKILDLIELLNLMID